MVRGKLWPINHPSLSSLASLHASLLSSQRSLLPSRSILPRSKATTQSPASWFVALFLLGLWLAENSSRDGSAANQKTGSGVKRVERDQLSRVRLFGYLPQKLNLKYEMYICSSCIWGRGSLVTELGVMCDNPKHVAQLWMERIYCI